MTVRVLSFGADVQPAAEGPYSILSFPEGHDPGVVYLENQAGSIDVEEAGEGGTLLAKCSVT